MLTSLQIKHYSYQTSSEN